MQAIHAPTLLNWGERDTLVPPWCGQVLLNGISDSRLLILPGAGHVVMYDRSADFNAALLSFLAALPSSP